MAAAVRAAGAGLVYAAALFLAGSVMGVFRVLLLEPHAGALNATMIELPLMLAVAWLFAGSLSSRLQIPARPSARLLMGAVALLFLVAAEFALASALGRRTDFGKPAAILGLAGQIAAAMVPFAQACLFRRDWRALP